MSKFRSLILIIGLSIIAVAAALLTVLIMYASGTIVTDPIELVFTVGSDKKTYDGTPLTLSDDAYVLESGNILEGHSAQVKIIGSQTNAGESESTLEVKIVDKKGFDVTDEYAVKVNVGKLTVEKCAISVSVKDDEVYYSGKEVIFDEYSIDGDLARGHKIGGVSGKLLNAGDTLPKNLAPVVHDAFDNDVTDNYDFVGFDIGDVKIVPRPLTIKPKNVTKVYDGTPLTATEYEIVSGSLAPGQKVDCTIVTMADDEATFVDCTDDFGERIQFGKFSILDENGDEVDYEKNYECFKEAGILKIEKREITVATPTYKFTYNGEAQFKDDIQIISGSLAPNQIISVTEHATVTNVNEEKDNEIKCAITLKDGTTVDGNYEITYVEGKLSVNKFNLTVYTKSYKKEYDKNETLGDYMSADERNYSLSVELPKKFKIETTYDEEIAKQKDFIKETPYELEVKIYLGDDECTGNFDIDVINGTYAITAKHVDISLSKDLKKVYDGKDYDFDNNKNNIFDGAKLDEYGISVNDFEIVYLKTKNVGTYYYTAEYKSNSKNFDVSIGTGKVEITQKQADLKFKLASVEMTYSGYKSFYSNDDYLIANLEVDGHKVKAAVFSKTELKSIKVVNVTVYDEEEGDITKNYKINYDKVTITVNVKPCTVRLVLPVFYADDDITEATLTMIANAVDATGLALGDVLSITSSNIQTDGDTYYQVEGCQIMCGGEEVTDYYIIENDGAQGAIKTRF